jgi:hypothetical protein
MHDRAAHLACLVDMTRVADAECRQGLHGSLGPRLARSIRWPTNPFVGNPLHAVRLEEPRPTTKGPRLRPTTKGPRLRPTTQAHDPRTPEPHNGAIPKDGPASSTQSRTDIDSTPTPSTAIGPYHHSRQPRNNESRLSCEKLHLPHTHPSCPASGCADPSRIMSVCNHALALEAKP